MPLHAAAPPHVVVLQVDDLGWGNVGYHRRAAGVPPSADVETPNIDALVRSGIELDRHYGFKSCSPSRSSFQTGRLPVHVLDANTVPESFNPNDTVSGYAGIPRNMTTMAAFLKPAGYVSHFVGKWDAGMATPQHTPEGRGFDTSLAYFHHSNDYYTEVGDGSKCKKPSGGPAIDIWEGSQPASWFNTSWGRRNNQRNGSLEDYEETKFLRHALQIIEAHGALPSPPPLFLNYATHLVHEPLQVPTVYLERLSSIITDNEHRLLYQSMVSMLDDVVGNVTAALKRTKLWARTLLLFTSDNGGPSFCSAHTANNFPLRGSKLSDWEGGVRVSAFVAGGWVPSSQAGTRREGLIAMADWLATFAELAGVAVNDTAARQAQLPPPDSISMAAYLRGDVSASPRSELQLDSDVLLKSEGRRLWKLFGSHFPSSPQGSTGWACFPGPTYPNATDPACKSGGHCNKTLGGCLFDLYADPTEHVDVAQTEPYALTRMLGRLSDMQSSLFKPDRGKADEAACDQVIANGGFYGPWLFLQ